MAIKIAINGAGRIGRAIAKIALSNNNFHLTQINDLANPSELLTLLRYDSTQEGLEELQLIDNLLFYKDKKVVLTSYSDNRDLELDCDILIEATGKYNNSQDNLHHIQNGVKKVVFTSIPTDDTQVAAFSLNESALHEPIVSAGSCTTTPLAFILDIVRDFFEIERGSVTSIHSYNADQNLLDAKHTKDLRLTRSSIQNIIPIKTGAAKNLHKIIDLDFKIEGRGMRVPTPDVSVLDIVLQLKKGITITEIQQVLYKEIPKRYGNILGTTNEKLVSNDFLGSKYAGVVDLDSTYVSNNLVKIIVWHDNEYGYANYLLNLIRKAEEIGAY